MNDFVRTDFCLSFATEDEAFRAYDSCRKSGGVRFLAAMPEAQRGEAELQDALRGSGSHVVYGDGDRAPLAYTLPNVTDEGRATKMKVVERLMGGAVRAK